MPSLEILAAFSVVCFLLSITPGPSILYIMARSISQGPSAGVSAASGMAIGSFVYVIATVLGLAAIFKYSPIAYTGLKIAGAVYLVYLGWQYFKPKEQAESNPSLTKANNFAIMKQSFVVELTNPKTALFFLAFLPQFVTNEGAPVSAQLMVLGVVYTLITLCCDISIALLSGKMGNWLNQKSNQSQWPDKLAGCVMFTLAGVIGYESTK
ncbi:threonine transporter RhtB [Pseudoalteromonas luteoviolacea]|uniref:Threonine transporter RhtB n=1 Tax=Pseudoalteromonas luteoviolacea TaxID=43657 RepID=A0A1C0TWJ0_9GAMM|nr:LysE family translocator [Pseudoalteromonas luteoviolacea]MBQ4810208.1 LysE family translocator [Pseudoalteromonas luteoviolacea]OCQ23686.1 threonine transporter RhtB [Pseudoalteromonas luteoviolacea]